MPGPPPKEAENRARRNPTVAMTKLPAAGRQGPAPKWPLPGDIHLATQVRIARAREKDLRFLAEDPDVTARERAKRDRDHAKALEVLKVLEATARAQRKHETTLWASLWATPMAVEWERLRWHRSVALYVRFQVLGELGDRKAASEARLREDALGLTPMSLLRLRWRVEDVPADGAAARSAPRAGARATYRHLRVAEPGTSAG